mgnify:FL=1
MERNLWIAYVLQTWWICFDAEMSSSSLNQANGVSTALVMMCVHEQETSTDLQIQFPLDFQHKIWRKKKFIKDNKMW